MDSIQKFQERVHAWAADNHDDRAVLNKMGWTGDRDLIFIPEGAGALFAQNTPAMTGRVQDHALGQLCEKLDVPYAWVSNNDRCPAELRAEVMNWKFAHGEDGCQLVRQRSTPDGQIVRAVVTDSYVPFDHAELVDAVVDALDSEGLKAVVTRDAVGDHLSAYVLVEGFRLPEVTIDPTGHHPDEGKLQPAIYLSNYECGGRKVRIHGGTYQGYCTNGTIYGYRTDKSDLFEFAHRWKTPQAMRVLVNNALAASLKMSVEGAQRFIEKRAERLPLVSLSGIIASWSSGFSIPELQRDSWLEASTVDANRNGGETTAWDVINNLTFLAGQTENTLVRESMEAAAGEMIFTPQLVRVGRR